jgi:hypothetical protein
MIGLDRVSVNDPTLVHFQGMENLVITCAEYRVLELQQLISLR